jgi:hypothetical protein
VTKQPTKEDVMLYAQRLVGYEQDRLKAFIHGLSPLEIISLVAYLNGVIFAQCGNEEIKDVMDMSGAFANAYKEAILPNVPNPGPNDFIVVIPRFEGEDYSTKPTLMDLFPPTGPIQ